MNKKAMGLYMLLLGINLSVLAQCNNQLVEKAAAQAGADAVYLRDFKVKLSQGSMDDPSPTGQFAVYLNKGIVYRFSVANDAALSGKAIVEISRRGQAYAGNYNFDSKSIEETFDFLCERSSTYQILINYGEGKEGCSAVVMAMVLQDSMSYIEPGIPTKSDSAGILYLWMDNKLQVASSVGKDARLEVTVSQGEIRKEGQYYLVRPAVRGELKVNVKVYNNTVLADSDSVNYTVEYPLLPLLILPDENAGTLSLGTFSGFGNITLLNSDEGEKSPYRLKQFSLSAGIDKFNELISDGDKLSQQQISFIRKLKPQEKLYLQNILFIDPEGKEHKGSVQEIIIQE
jgi:hypothetical protein